MLILRARNFFVLRHLQWALGGTTVLTGANGSGKTTVLLALRLLRAAFDRGLPEAVSLTLGGSHNLKNRQAAENEPIELGLDIEELSWRVSLIRRGSSVDYLTDETLKRGAETVFSRDGLGNFFYRGQKQDLGAPASERLGLRWVAEVHPEDEAAAQLASVMRSIQVFYDPDLRSLRDNGSRATDDRHLHSRGSNVLTMLRKWRDRREDRARFEFVDQGLRAAFPNLYDGMDFDAAGQSISALFYQPGSESPTLISHEANGVLAMLLNLAQVASAKDGGLVAIDEPENSLHPYAIRRFVRMSRAWAEKHRLTLIVTTHSPVLLGEFDSTPEQVFVMEHGGPREPPIALDQLRDRQWLANYTLGELFSNYEFASNEPQ